MSVRRAAAPAKLNLSLQVRSRDSSGMHPIRSLQQSIGWCDILTMEESEADLLTIHGSDALPLGEENLVWKAVEALRGRTGGRRPAEFVLWKRIPAAAGLAGGSSDAAAALLLYGGLAGLAAEELAGPAASLGADVPFCLQGGRRWVEGYGEQVGPPIGEGEGFWTAAAVPPFPLETARVYEAWDRMGEPPGPRTAGSALPPELRPHGPLSNDLYPAAVGCEPELDDWRAELENRWGRPVLMSGSGPALFGFFSDRAEAQEALVLAPPEARAAFAASPADRGAHPADEQPGKGAARFPLK